MASFHGGAISKAPLPAHREACPICSVPIWVILRMSPTAREHGRHQADQLMTRNCMPATLVTGGRDALADGTVSDPPPPPPLAPRRHTYASKLFTAMPYGLTVSALPGDGSRRGGEIQPASTAPCRLTSSNCAENQPVVLACLRQ